ncbi:hypothetical protein ANO11243_022470 [Dothideomycetidae sp. 11243]|nr:hypothetical protein ANO11243_022470 [fungal sp. No.11243]
MPPPHPDTISKSDFASIQSRYPSLVPSKLRILDNRRLHGIPSALATRSPPSLTKAEVSELVDWKLSHGTFRPRLKALVESNSDIPLATEEAFALISAAAETPQTQSVLAALHRLTKLSGVGPATASLLLSTYRPASVPFFGDEVFRWTMWDGKGEVWGRGIKYSVKEYGELLGRVREVADQLGVGVREVECVAWVLGREAKGFKGEEGGKVEAEGAEKVDGDAEGGETEVKTGEKKRNGGADAKVKAEVEVEKTNSATGEKRRGKDTAAVTDRKHTSEGPRRSKRIKTSK